MLARMRFSWLVKSPKFVFILGSLFILLGLSGCTNNIGILNPKGIVAFEERKLLFDTLALMLIVVLPVIVMSIAFIYHYQVGHRLRDYKPNWSHSYFLESLWWGIPCVIITILAVLTYMKTYELDPFHPLAGESGPPIKVQVIGLPWKWLFIYPDFGIASLNYLAIPVDREIDFSLTVDNVPMSAFFIPQLGSQIYTMAGMRSRLYLQGHEVGIFDGMNTQYNGDGFSEMHFPAQVMFAHQFDAWVNKVKQQHETLDAKTYHKLLVPSVADKPRSFAGVEDRLFDQVVQLYMTTYGPTHPRHDQVLLDYSDK